MSDTLAVMAINITHHRDFLNEFEKTDIPFKQILRTDREAKVKLFEEFLKTPKKPDIGRYVSQFFTNDQLTEGFEQADRRIPVSSSAKPVMASFVGLTDMEKRIYKIQDEFYNKLINGRLDEEFYVFDLTSTLLYNTLKNIEKETESLKRFVVSNTDVNIYGNEAEIFASSIFDLVGQLPNGLGSLILSHLVEDDDNIHITIESIHGGSHAEITDRYRRLKRHFNFYIKRAVSESAYLFVSNSFKSNRLSPYLSSISSKESLDFFYNLLKDHDGDFVNDTIRYFTSGPRSGYFEPINFLNLWHKQWVYFETNWDKPYSVVEVLKSLRLSEEQKHILFGFILKFYGGYPIQHISFNSATALRFVERAFLSYPKNSPEKTFALHSSHQLPSPNTLTDNSVFIKYPDEDIQSLSATNNLDFYFNVNNIANSELVFQTFDYFESGQGKGTFTPLGFLNLLCEQEKFIRRNLRGKVNSTLDVLKSLPLDDEQKHILFGFILKWKGGYPIQVLDADEKIFFQLLENEFLKYPKQTPEKEFCSKEFWISSQQNQTLPNNFTEKKLADRVESFSSDDKHQTEQEHLNHELYKHRFDDFHIENNIDPRKLFDLLKVNKTPYRIALLHKTGYIEFVENEFGGGVKTNLYKIMAKILKSHDRKVKGNILVLNPKTDENKKQYTSHLHVRQVEEDLSGL
ncbi:hypothetical protein L0663_18220 [Dyadobacter sp. CY107]|uniref:hypothetical protein n=1 Tax=Dyadobacter fanqingshengii TaxID=2906443 RepID=UPI001F208681|nr:hypothetical protein [Dyadobacter fanqingshengii]MCF2505333.1 hypothetical protein [Dyadobacter fanqingshengii]